MDIGLLQGAGKLKPDDLMSMFVREAIRQRAFDHAALSIGTTKVAIGKEILAATEGGESIAELGRRIDGMMKGHQRFRSLRIARTEMTDVINDGASHTLIREGFQEKEWRTVVDGRERPTHAGAHGQVVGIHEPFQVGGQSAQFPGDSNLSASERINCRCTVVGTGLPEDRKAKLDDRFIRTHGALERRFVVSLRQAFREQRDRVLSHFPS